MIFNYLVKNISARGTTQKEWGIEIICPTHKNKRIQIMKNSTILTGYVFSSINYHINADFNVESPPFIKFLYRWLTLEKYIHIYILQISKLLLQYEATYDSTNMQKYMATKKLSTRTVRFAGNLSEILSIKNNFHQ